MIDCESGPWILFMCFQPPSLTVSRQTPHLVHHRNCCHQVK